MTNSESFAVIFDNDGVLCDTEILSGKAFQKCLKHFGYTLPDNELVIYCGLDAKSAFETLHKRFGSTPCYEDFWKEKSIIYEHIVDSSPIQPIKGAKELLELLKSNSIPFAVASSAGAKRIVFNLENAGLIEYFSDKTILSPNASIQGKPAPDLFLSAARALGIPENCCIGVEDSINGLKAIESANMKPIAISTTFPYDELVKYTSFVYPNLCEITLPLLRDIVRGNDRYE